MTASIILLIAGLLLLSWVYAKEEKRRYRDKLARLLTNRVILLGTMSLLVYGLFSSRIAKADALALSTGAQSIRSAPTLDTLMAGFGDLDLE